MQSIDEGLPIGTILNERFRIEKKIGAGGMSHVYFSSDLWKEDNFAVVKIPFIKHLKDKWVVRKFKQEAESLARLRHPNIVELLGHGIYEQQFPFVILEYIDGVTLTTIMNDLIDDQTRTVNILLQIVEAVEHAHNEEIFHRDLKPDNVMVEKAGTPNEHIKIIDFGIARIDKSFFKTSPNTRYQVGTPHYISPNRLRHDPDDRADDIYALGLITYEMLTGTNPLRAAKDFDELKKIHENIESPRHLNPNLPIAVNREISKALSLNQFNRHSTVSEFGNQLKKAFQIDEYKTTKNIIIEEDENQIPTLENIPAEHIPISKEEKQKELFSSISIGEKFILNGEFEAAIDFYDKIITQEVTSDLFYSRRAMAYLMVRKYENALVDSKEALKLNPKNDFAYLINGIIYRLKLWTEEAEKSLLKALSINQNNIEAALILGDIYASTGDSDKAFKYYIHIYRVNPHFIWGYMNSGNLYYQKGDFESAIKDFTEAIKINPEYSWNYFQRAKALAKKGNSELAIVDITEAIRLSPNNKNLYNERAKLFFKLGRNDKALEDFNQVNILSDIEYSFSEDEKELSQNKKTGLTSLLDYLEWTLIPT